MPLDEQVKAEINRIIGEAADFCWQAEKRWGDKGGKQLSGQLHALRSSMIAIVDENAKLRREKAQNDADYQDLVNDIKRARGED